jgi:hypothetical protein
MIRGLFGFALALACLLPLGAGTLLLAGAWRRFGWGLRAGLSVFAGMAAAAVLLPPLVYIGLSPSIPVVLLAGAVGLGVGLYVESKRPPDPQVTSCYLPEEAPGRVSGASLLVTTCYKAGPGLVLGLPLALLAIQAAAKPVDGYDAFSGWALKAKLLAFGGTFTGALDDRAFATASAAPPVTRQFPIGLPALDAYFVRDIGGANFRIAHLLFVLFLAGLALAVWALLRPHVAAWPLAAGLSLLLWMPAARDQALSAYADVPLACFWVAAALSIGLWVSGQGGDRLALGAVFAAAALATKRDAIAFCFVLFAVAFAGLLVRRARSRLVPLGIAALAVALSTVPWRIFLSVHGLEDKDVGFSLSRAADRAGELDYVLRKFGHLVLQSTYLGAVPLALVAALVLLARRRDRQLGAGVLVLVLGLLASLAFVYLSGLAGVHYLVRTSAYRTLMTPTLFAAAVLPLLLTRALGAEREPHSPRRAAPRSRGRTPPPER